MKLTNAIWKAMKLTRLSSILTLLCAVSLLPRAQAGDIEFKTLAAEETGLGAAMQKWHDDELERQGGKFKGHGWWPWGLRAFDFDNDGDLDLLPSHHGAPHSIVLKSLLKETGKLTFVDVTAELGVSSRDLPGADDRPWIWDFDGDGFLDVAGMSDESKPNSLRNLGGKKLAIVPDFSFSPMSHPREVLDLNGDGYLDVDGGSRGQWFYTPETKTFQRTKTPRFQTPAGVPDELVASMAEIKKQKNNRFFRASYLTHSIVGYDTLGYSPNPIDLNGDGRGDVVVRGSGGYGASYLGRYLLATPEGALVEKTQELGLPAAGAPMMIEDLTGDGRQDLLIAGKETGGFYINSESGRFQRLDNDLSQFLTRKGPYLLRAFPGDLDNDGDQDLVMSNPRYGREQVFQNNGDGDFKSVLSASGWDANPVVVCDIDDDGRLDVVIGGPGGHRSTAITIYLNQTADSGGFVKIHPRMPKPNPFAVGSVLEAFRAGELGKEGCRPFLVEKAHPDATPVHVGLGTAETFDLRVTFPGGKKLEGRGLKANSRLVAGLAEGTIREVKP